MTVSWVVFCSYLGLDFVSPKMGHRPPRISLQWKYQSLRKMYRLPPMIICMCPRELAGVVPISVIWHGWPRIIMMVPFRIRIIITSSNCLDDVARGREAVGVLKQRRRCIFVPLSVSQDHSGGVEYIFVMMLVLNYKLELGNNQHYTVGWTS
jgi:hypothetical protein